MGALDGSDGTGLGGGVFLAGTGAVNNWTKIKGNSASTGYGDIYGSFS
jgi:hypothetical protein